VNEWDSIWVDGRKAVIGASNIAQYETDWGFVPPVKTCCSDPLI
jgi:hypothetical protein